jgi:TM2 domain-containing membrane protein YozV
VPEYSHMATPTRIRNPSAAVALSLIPGLGQVYNGMLVRGVILFAATLLGLFIFIVPGVCIWIYSIYDAYQAAEKINRGEIAVST